MSAKPVAHVHSNGDFCADRQITSDEWPVYLFTAEQMAQEVKRLREALEGLLNTWNAVCDVKGWDRDHMVAAEVARAALQGDAEACLPVSWVGADGTHHEISLDYAAQIAKWMFDTYGDVPQVDAALQGDK